MVRQILHIDLDAFFVSVELGVNPQLRGKPVVVGGRPHRRGVVASASYEARPFGIRAGMPLATAHRLCPEAIFLESNFPRYRDASLKFHRILGSFSPSVEPMGLDEAYLDATGLESIYSSAFHLGRLIKERVKKELGLTASVGIASNKVVAKIASALSKPDGLLEVAQGEEKEFLAPLPVEQLPGVGKKTEKFLKEIGITTIGQLANFPVTELKNRFGTAGIVLHHYANGIDNRKVEPPGEAKSISREITFAEDTFNRCFLAAILRYLSERVGAELRRQGKQAKTITLKLRYADFETISRRLTLGSASNTDEIIFDAGFRLLDKALSSSKKLIRLLGIEASNLTNNGKQLSMFDSVTERTEYLDKAIDHIRESYGFTSIQTGRTFSLKEVFAPGKED